MKRQNSTDGMKTPKHRPLQNNISKHSGISMAIANPQSMTPLMNEMSLRLTPMRVTATTIFDAIIVGFLEEGYSPLECGNSCGVHAGQCIAEDGLTTDDLVHRLRLRFITNLRMQCHS
jgi:hypothetical protein